MDVFESCQSINDALNRGDEQAARDRLIQLLDFHQTNKLQQSSLVNHLIRQTGLYPYIDLGSSDWTDRFAFESFKANIGTDRPITLHREQSYLLSRLLNGDNLAISAPTSFGKSFVIDSFIAIRRPKLVVIIVPTIALTDEVRRRLQKKFSAEYRIITTADIDLAEKNILVFPQERALSYISRLKQIDILVVDEFYKASAKFDRVRSPTLLRVMLKLSSIAKQRYFLAPNVSSLNASPFTQGMEFLELNFNTVFLKKTELYREIGRDEAKKDAALLKVLQEAKSKSLIYAGTYSGIDSIASLLIDKLQPVENPLLNSFADWLSKNYSSKWQLTNLVRRGVGIHTGQLHRSLSQIQVRLFEEDSCLENIISTSSIIEGVNTCAKNVIIWKSKKGSSKLDDFTYKNIIGRGGRMFKHFVGNIFILDAPPNSIDTELELEAPDSLYGEIDEIKFKDSMSPEQMARVIAYKEEMGELLGKDAYSKAISENLFQTSDSSLIKNIAISMRKNPAEWNGLAYLNSENPDDWDRMLYKIINLQPGGWEIQHRKFVAFVKILSGNWRRSVVSLIGELDNHDIGLNEFFKLERNATNKLAALVSDVNAMQKLIFQDPALDVSQFAARLSHAFMPPAVYGLEEYGLPRMISKKIHDAGVMDFSDLDLSLHNAVNILQSISLREVIRRVPQLQEFDRYLLNYFYEGIQLASDHS
ncbi:DEAD/DEAH box helicase [Sphingomonas sp. NCPPB 2930]